MARPRKDMAGKRFDKLTVLRSGGLRGHAVVWVCRCDCGTIIEKLTSQLDRPTQKFFACTECEDNPRARLKRTHGATNTSLYAIWGAMRHRCHNPNSSNFAYYGGKGIQVCQAWRESFVAFRDWANANGYEVGLSIERVDSNGNYEPANCEWITRSENAGRASRARVLKLAVNNGR